MVLLWRLQQERIGLKVPLPGYPALQTPTAAAFTQRWIQPTKSYEMKVKFTIQQERMGLKVPLPGYPALQTPTDTSLTERWIQPTTEYIRDNRFQDTQPSIGTHSYRPHPVLKSTCQKYTRWRRNSRLQREIIGLNPTTGVIRDNHL